VPYQGKNHPFGTQLFAADPLAPFGIDPVFQASSDLYHVEVGDLMGLYNTSSGSGEINFQQMPYGFFPRNVSGLADGFFVMVDSSLDSERAAQVWQGLVDGLWIDRNTETMKARLMVLYSEKRIAVIDTDFSWEDDGSISVNTQVMVGNVEFLRETASHTVSVIAQVILSIAIIVGLVAYMVRSGTLDLLVVGTTLLISGAQALYIASFSMSSSLSLQQFYKLYDAGQSADARWWLPAKVDIVTGSEVPDSPQDLRQLTVPGGPGRWTLPDNTTDLEQLGEVMISILSVTQFQLVAVSMQAVAAIFLVGLWLRFASIDSRIEAISRTLLKALPDLRHFAFAMGCVTILMASIVNIVFGSHVEVFSDYTKSFASVLQFMLVIDLKSMNTLSIDWSMDLLPVERAAMRLTYTIVTLVPIFTTAIVLGILLKQWSGNFKVARSPMLRRRRLALMNMNPSNPLNGAVGAVSSLSVVTNHPPLLVSAWVNATKKRIDPLQTVSKVAGLTSRQSCNSLKAGRGKDGKAIVLLWPRLVSLKSTAAVQPLASKDDGGTTMLAIVCDDGQVIGEEELLASLQYAEHQSWTSRHQPSAQVNVKDQTSPIFYVRGKQELEIDSKAKRAADCVLRRFATAADVQAISMAKNLRRMQAACAQVEIAVRETTLLLDSCMEQVAEISEQQADALSMSLECSGWDLSGMAASGEGAHRKREPRDIHPVEARPAAPCPMIGRPGSARPGRPTSAALSQVSLSLNSDDEKTTPHTAAGDELGPGSHGPALNK